MTTETKLNVTVRNLLASAALATVKASAAVQEAQERAKGAYALFVDGAIAAGDPAVLEAAADDLFTEIRTTGKVKDARGRSHSIGAKPNKDGTGFLVPSSVSAAKSYMLDAMTRSIPLTEDGKARTFGAIRKDVQTAKQSEREATATGDEALRLRAAKLLAILSDQVAERKGEALARTCKAIDAMFKSAQVGEKTDTKPETKGAAIAAAA
jgi:hypothetical protein